MCVCVCVCASVCVCGGRYIYNISELSLHIKPSVLSVRAVHILPQTKTNKTNSVRPTSFTFVVLAHMFNGVGVIQETKIVWTRGLFVITLLIDVLYILCCTIYVYICEHFVLFLGSTQLSLCLFPPCCQNNNCQFHPTCWQ